MPLPFQTATSFSVFSGSGASGLGPPAG